MSNKKLSTFRAVVLAFSILLIPFCALPTGLAQNASLSYKLVDPNDGAFKYTLNVDISQTLTDFFQGLPHSSASDGDIPKFVTPFSVKPIADVMRQIYPDDEDFANGVLTLVHQIPYNETVPEYYPVETLQRNSGDCDMFSLLAASIMKAGGLDAVLLHYTNEEHMNIGVHLNEAPKDTRSAIYSLEYNNVTYYVAECTSSTWTTGWRVGECPDDLKNAPMSIIALDKTEQIEPGQVTASFTKLDSTTLGINISPFLTILGNKIIVNGQISPSISNQKVIIYSSINGAPWTILANVTTLPDGHFSYELKSMEAGYQTIRASWTGNNDYAGAASTSGSVFVLPSYTIELIAIMIAVISCIGIYSAARKRKRAQLTVKIPHTEEGSTKIDGS